MLPDGLNSDVDRVLSEQRDESDARSIINEVEKINTLEGKHRYRWIWELLQNAKDEAGEGADIEIVLTPNSFTFQHTGRPFLANNLLALLRKTSTKPINGILGNTGKFGTGFVTSHLLNKIVRVKGVYKNTKGLRLFSFFIDRRSTDLEDMKAVIAQGIQVIREIDNTPAETGKLSLQNSFHYDLKESAHQIAEGGLSQLLDNLSFTMLVNKQIRSLQVTNPKEKNKYLATPKQKVIDGIDFIQLKKVDSELESTGLLIQEIGKLIIASPVLFINERYSLCPIGDRARLYKDLPLIGTEQFFIPVILQHGDFQPTEQRDGVRTKISPDISETQDVVAKKNRDCLSEFIAAFPEYLNLLIKANVNNLHLICESGIPPNVESYYDLDWYKAHIQKPIRAALITHRMVKTVSGKNIPLSEAKFPKCDHLYLESMYDLMVQWYPDSCPDKNSYEDWVRIIEQETENWPNGITVTIEDLVKEVAEKKTLAQFQIENSDKLIWLQELVLFIEKCGMERLGHDYPIYPNKDGELIIQSKIFHNPGIDERFFLISNGMGRRLETELLPLKFKAQFIEPFNVKAFLISLNTEIGAIGMKIEKALPNQIQAIVNICCTFKPGRATKREQWFELLNELIPELAKNRVEINIDEEYQWDTAEKTALKYVCYLIQKSENIVTFSLHYFSENRAKMYKWLNRFYEFVFRNEENKSVVSSYKIIPTQDGIFRVYSEGIFREDDPQMFDNIIKDLFKDYSGKGDPRAFLVDKEIISADIRSTTLHKLSRVIDDLFNNRDSEDKVHKDGKYHTLFLTLKEWIEKRSDFIADEYFPLFSKKQPVLYLKAFGGATFSRLLKLKKTVDELEQLDNIGLTATEMLKLDQAIAELGSSEQLIQKAQEMIDFADLVRWRQEVGKAAEDAFVEALGEAESKFLNPENPDIGKDFVIKLNGKEYSIEIKSAAEGNETVKMSLKQGEFAVRESGYYALCVISRPPRQLTTKDEFIGKARFVTDIGIQIGDGITKWKEGIEKLDSVRNVRVELDSKTGAIYVNKSTWSQGKTFNEFLSVLRDYFQLDK